MHFKLPNAELSAPATALDMASASSCSLFAITLAFDDFRNNRGFHTRSHKFHTGYLIFGLTAQRIIALYQTMIKNDFWTDGAQ